MNFRRLLLDKGFSGNTLDIGGGHGELSKLWQPQNGLYVVADPLYRASITELDLYKQNKLAYVDSYAEKLPFLVIPSIG